MIALEMRTCSSCGQTKPLNHEHFPPERRICRVCDRARRAARFRATYQRHGVVGGNRRPQTFRQCVYCGDTFGPLDKLSQQFCSVACKGFASRVPVRKERQKPTPEARAAQSRVAALVRSGQMARPDCCQECGRTGIIEAAHEDYGKPEDVRWLCASCHRRWDLAHPKGGTWESFENLTGQQAERVHA